MWSHIEAVWAHLTAAMFCLNITSGLLRHSSEAHNKELMSRTVKDYTRASRHTKHPDGLSGFSALFFFCLNLAVTINGSQVY